MWSSALLDCGVSKTVYWKEWLTQYVNNLSDEDQQKVSFGQSNHIYIDLEMVERLNLYIPLKLLRSLEATNLI